MTAPEGRRRILLNILFIIGAALAFVALTAATNEPAVAIGVIVVVFGGLYGAVSNLDRNGLSAGDKHYADRIENVEQSAGRLRDAYAISSVYEAVDTAVQVTPEAEAEAQRLHDLVSSRLSISDGSRPKNPAEFVAFWEDTYKRIVHYHNEAHGQLKSSYRLAQLSAVGGFVVVGGLGVAAAQASSSTQAISAAAVGTVGAALAAFIGRTFNSTYTQSLRRSSAFFHEPVVIARLLAAERLLAEYGSGSEKERSAALTAMITAAVSFDVGQVPEVQLPGEDG